MKNILEYLETTVNRVPDKTAFADETRSLTFRELCDGARRIGTGLAKSGIIGQPILVVMERSVDMIMAFFGVVYSGNYYVPADAGTSGERLSRIVECVKPAAVISSTGAVFENDPDNMIKTLGALRRFSFSDLLNEAEESTDGRILAGIRDGRSDSDLLYVVFTSGSTGMPKGVAVAHRSVIDYAEQLTKTLDIREDTVFGNQAPLFLDACLKEILSTVKCGATTFLIPQRLLVQPVRLIEYLNENKINTICWVASELSYVSGLSAFDSVRPKELRLVAFGGEVLQPKHLRSWQEAAPQARFVNLYGPTECTGMSCFYEVTRSFADEEPIPIGRPFENTEVYLLDANGDLITKPGREGEIVIGGAGVAAGYVGIREEEAACVPGNVKTGFFGKCDLFINADSSWELTCGQASENAGRDGAADVRQNESDSCRGAVCAKQYETVFRTGDIAKYNELGELIFVGRRDRIIKHRGYRISLTELENVACSVEGVSEAVCICREDPQRIVLNYTGTIDEVKLRTEIATKLPRYMVPEEVRRVKQLSRGAGGKVSGAAGES